MPTAKPPQINRPVLSLSGPVDLSSPTLVAVLATTRTKTAAAPPPPPVAAPPCRFAHRCQPARPNAERTRTQELHGR
jgi:hypothetical protein